MVCHPHIAFDPTSCVHVLSSSTAWMNWQHTPTGQLAKKWFEDHCAQAIAYVFGYYALQLGLPHYFTLSTSRIHTRCLVLEALEALEASENLEGLDKEKGHSHDMDSQQTQLLSRWSQLPLPSQSVDLITLPHTLENTQEPSALLAEVARVLVPEGHVWIGGFNAHSLWTKHLRRTLPLRQLMTVGQIKQQLQTHGLSIVQGQFGVYRPWATQADAWNRWQWLDLAGNRWWPAWGACYSLLAVKRVAGLQLQGSAWSRWQPPWKTAPASATASHLPSSFFSGKKS
jgi:hypothetical protein